ncbi:MAG TPA: ABC transporter permease, partial [Phycisphaerae bacterium]
MKMPISIRLAIRQWLARPLRPVLCSLAISAAVALIICVGAAMDSLRYSVDNAIGQALGVAEVHVRPAQRETDARVPDGVLQKVRALPEVDFAAGRLNSQAALDRGDNHLWFDVSGIDEPLDDKLRPKTFIDGHTLTGSPDEILVDSKIAETMSLKVGEEVAYKIKDLPPRNLKIVGIVRRPSIEFITKPTMYVPLAVLTKDLDIPPELSVLDIKLKGSSGIEDFDLYAKDLQKILGPSIEASPG